jgi:RNA polymerase sigma-70 factor, ECF subfamily
LRQNTEVPVNDDAQRISATLAGDTTAFGELVLKYQDRLYNTVVHVVGNAEDARDVVQEALVQAFTKLETFRQTSAFYTWLYRITFNVAVSLHRRRKPTFAINCGRESHGVEPLDYQDGPIRHLEREERRVQIRQALNQLNEEHRAIIVLREIDGYCYETIAEILDMPVGTVRSRLHRARLELREQLKTLLID